MRVILVSKKARERLMSLAMQRQARLDFNPNALILHDRTTVLYLNHAAAHLLGYECWNEAQSLLLTDVLNLEDSLSIASFVEQLEKKGDTVQELVLPFRTRNGYVFEAAVKARATEFLGHKVVLATIKPLGNIPDVAAEERFDERKVTAKDRLRDGILNPLTTLQGFLELRYRGEIDELPVTLLLREIENIQKFIEGLRE
ncbi:PAS domain-containing protein [Alicyclobacillus sp. SP_1]|uniref:PAS domain-containing protein n=1 Tax=Alicyclobacillus sp. SP_1 TaxID=2942475 RepID=UPI0021581A44|nr:PAS domain-containing protein [Alicyclobacillus sp. SP_1]